MRMPLSIGALSFFSALPRAIIGGLAGTVVFTLMMRFLAPEMIGHPMDIAAVLGRFTRLGTPTGAVMHFVLGTLGFAIGFVIVGPYLPGPGWLRGIIFMAAVWFLAGLIAIAGPWCRIVLRKGQGSHGSAHRAYCVRRYPGDGRTAARPIDPETASL
jgi:hypothetical protein